MVSTWWCKGGPRRYHGRGWPQVRFRCVSHKSRYRGNPVEPHPREADRLFADTSIYGKASEESGRTMICAHPFPRPPTIIERSVVRPGATGFPDRGCYGKRAAGAMFRCRAIVAPGRLGLGVLGCGRWIGLTDSRAMAWVARLRPLLSGYSVPPIQVSSPFTAHPSRAGYAQKKPRHRGHRGAGLGSRRPLRAAGVSASCFSMPHHAFSIHHDRHFVKWYGCYEFGICVTVSANSTGCSAWLS